MSGEADGRRLAARRSRPSSRSSRRRRACRGRRRADAAFALERDRDVGPRGLHHRADRADQHRSGAAHLRRRDPRSAWSTCSATPERWAATTHSFLWAHATHARAELHRRRRRFTLPVPCTYDLELAAAKYLYSLPDGEVPLSFHFTGSVLHRGDDGPAAGRARCPWSCSAHWRMPVATWREMMERHYPNGGWVRLHADTVDALRRAQGAARAAVATTPASPSCSTRPERP